MLSKKYESAIVGLNYVSLLKGIFELTSHRSVLIIDNEQYQFGNNWYLNLGELEKRIFIELGNHYNLAQMINIDDYLTPTNTILHIDNMFIEFSDSPYSSLKELARKLPDSFSTFFQNEMLQIKAESFDQSVMKLIDLLAENSFYSLDENKALNLFLGTDPLLEKMFNRFADYMNEDKALVKELHYALQVMFRTNFSNITNKLESMYLLLSLIAPRYSVNEKKLTNDLLFTFRKLGGDLKASWIEDWGIQQLDLKFILLHSVDGLVGVEKCYYFAQLGKQKFFKHKADKRLFLSISLECIIDHDFVDLFAGKRIVFLIKNRMGGDFPFWEVSIDESGLLTGVYAYANNLGTKPSFYFHHALDDIYQSLLKILPGLTRSDWVARTKLKKGRDLWVEDDARVKSDFEADYKSGASDLYQIDSKLRVEGLEYCGPDRTKSLGFYGYLLDVFAQR